MLRRKLLAVLGALCVWAASLSAVAQEPLASWREGAAKRAIVEFVTKATTEGSPEFIPVPQRIAVFDNDGTLWCEQPIYFQFAFALDRVKQLAPQHPEWNEREPYKSVLAGDIRTALASGEKAVAELMLVSHAGMTTDEFAETVRNWLATARHPRFKRPYNQCIYVPMVDLLEYLRANGFKTFIVSGGGIEFMRVWCESAYGIPPEQVVGSMGKLKYEVRNGKPVIVKLPELDFLDDGAGKPVGIQRLIGRRPVFAAGNSDGDFEMLEWTTSGEGLRFGLIVHHTDATREFAYDRDSQIGRLRRGLDEAAQRAWIVVDMKSDWARVFPEP